MPTAPSCIDMLFKLHDAIISLQTTGRVTTISFAERSVTYTPADLKSLQQMFRVYYRSCGAESGLIDIADQSLIERGRPVTISNN